MHRAVLLSIAPKSYRLALGAKRSVYAESLDRLEDP